MGAPRSDQELGKLHAQRMKVDFAQRGKDDQVRDNLVCPCAGLWNYLVDYSVPPLNFFIMRPLCSWMLICVYVCISAPLHIHVVYI